MKTTLIIDDGVMKRLKESAARQKRTLSDLVESALRRMLETRKSVKRRLSPLPKFKGGAFMTDVSSREALFRAMGED